MNNNDQNIRQIRFFYVVFNINIGKDREPWTMILVNTHTALAQNHFKGGEKTTF